MNNIKSGTHGALTRTASAQLVWLGLLATIGFAVLMGLLYWASTLTGNRTATLDAIDAESGTITLLLRT